MATTDKNNVEAAKEWLRNWYKERLPVVGKDNLWSDVKKGLRIKYYLPDHKKAQENPDESYVGSLGWHQPDWPEYSHIVLRTTNGSIPIHEFNHAIQYAGSWLDLSPYFTDESYQQDKRDPQEIPYLERPSERHSRIMEIRYNSNLDPKKTDYTIEDVSNLKQHPRNKEIFEELQSGGMSDEDIRRALNLWASNQTNPYEKKDAVYLARNGKTLNYFNYFN